MSLVRLPLIVILVLLLQSCGISSISKLNSNREGNTNERAMAIKVQVERALNLNYADSAGELWQSVQVNLKGPWVINSADSLWGSLAKSRPSQGKCKADQLGCHPQFQRYSCSSDSDCPDQTLQCKELQATVDSWGKTPEKLCQYPSDKLLDDLYSTIVASEERLDFLSLSAPNGLFHEALVNALAFISHGARPIQVRILLSGDSVTQLNFLQPPKKYYERIIQDIAAHDGQLEQLKFNIAWLSSNKLSWNHVKLLIADGKIGLQGGHNWWDEDYLGDSSVSDLSMRFSGEALISATQFADKLWSVVWPGWTFYQDGVKFEAFAPHIQLDELGTTAAISMGRLGIFGSNPSDQGFKTLIDSAQSELLISQQDLYNITSQLPQGRSIYQPNLFQALLRGVRVHIIQSNKEGLNYGMVAPEISYSALQKDFSRYVRKMKRALPEGQSPEQFFCEHTQYAPFRYSPNWNKWQDGGPLSHHNKLIVVDKSAFYIGSQNFYPANLQEFGLAVFDTEKTAELLAAYWNPADQASAASRLDCKF